MSTLMFFRLCCRAPLTLMRSMAIAKTHHSSGRVFARQAGEIRGSYPCNLWLKIETCADFQPSRGLGRSGVTEERRCLHSGKGAQVCAIEKIERLHIPL